MSNAEKELKQVTIEFVRNDFGLMLLDMIDTARRDNNKQGKDGRGVYDDYDYRYAAAVVASAFVYKDRVEWTTALKGLSTEYRHDISDTDNYYVW